MMRSIFQRAAESLASIALGEPAAIPSARRFRELEALEYRASLKEAERTGDVKILQAELDRVQLTASELDRIVANASHEDWPDDGDPFEPVATKADQSSANAAPTSS